MYYIIVFLTFALLALVLYLTGYRLIKKYAKTKKLIIRTFLILFTLSTTNILCHNGRFGNYFFGTLIYCYSDEDYNFKKCELLLKNVDFKDVENSFQSYKKLHKIKSADKLYRNFKKNYLFFWLWYDYAVNPKWELDYLPPNQNE